MADWSIDPDFCDEPTHVPTGGECAHAMRSENCGRTDCEDCGEEAAAELRSRARLDWRGVVTLAREAARVQEIYGSQVPPDSAVTLVDVALVRVGALCLSTALERGRAYAWAEGVIDALCRNPWLQTGDYRNDVSEQAAYMVGRLLVELHMLNEHLATLEAQAMAKKEHV